MASDLRSLLESQLGGRPAVSPPACFTEDGRRPTGDSRLSTLDSRLDIHGTTVIAVKYDKGVINVGDRRATANFAVMYDRAEKVLPIDDYTLLAISGSFARAMEVVRYLRTAFKLYERTYLQEMSLEGKLAELA